MQTLPLMHKARNNHNGEEIEAYSAINILTLIESMPPTSFLKVVVFLRIAEQLLDCVHVYGDYQSETLAND